MGTADEALRLACSHCGYSRTANASLSFEAYDSGDPPFNAPLWLETQCCGGHRLWALNEIHLDYLAGYVSERQRAREFPSAAGSRQLAYKLPRWMKLAKNRAEILGAIDRLRATL